MCLMARARKVNFFKLKRKIFKSHRQMNTRSCRRMKSKSPKKTKGPRGLKKKKTPISKKPVIFKVTNMDNEKKNAIELNQKENENTNIILDKASWEEKSYDQSNLIKNYESTDKNKIGTKVNDKIDSAEVLEPVNMSVIVLDDTIVAPSEVEDSENCSHVNTEQNFIDGSFLIDTCEDIAANDNVDPNSSIYCVSTEPESSPKKRKSLQKTRRKRIKLNSAQTWKDVKLRKQSSSATEIPVITLSDSDSDSDVCLIVSDDSDTEVQALENYIPLPPCSFFHSKVVKSQNEAFSKSSKKCQEPQGLRPVTVDKSQSEAVSKSSKKCQELGGLRPIVIDGCNVAFGHGRRTMFSSKGLKICADYFTEKGHKVYIFIPQFRRRHPQTTNFEILDELEKEGLLICTPSRRVNNKLICSYDDRFIVEFASKKGAVIITRDNYRDLMSEENDSWRDTISKRLLMYTFIDDMIMFPDDPLGRGGPNLKEFLHFPKEKPKDDTNSNS